MSRQEIAVIKKELQEALEQYVKCELCPRECHVNRLQGQKGYCKEGSMIVLARAALHMWEEPCISGKEGSGAVFFGGCSMGCVFCQNAQIAAGERGKEITPGRLKEIFLELQEKGANNINLVTPTHYIPQIIWAVKRAREEGLAIPIVYNTSGYEKIESLKQLEGIVDIYLPDFKYYEKEIAEKYSNAPDYFTYAAKALEEMVRQIPKAVFDERGMMQKGVIVRHLVLPNQKEDSKRIIQYIHETYQDDVYISIMNQYTPMENLVKYPELMRKTTTYEYQKVVDYARSIGVENGFIQEGNTSSESFIPAFDDTGVMRKEMVVMNFSHVYEEEQFYQKENYKWVDCSEVHGTNCYCDQEAGECIRKKIESYTPYGIHFIDSGNYHYISKFWLEKIKEPFILIVMDHHSDMQPSLFEQLSSCGGWVKEVLDTNPYVEKVLLLGAKQSLIDKIDSIYDKRIICYNESNIEKKLNTILSHQEEWKEFSKKHIAKPVYLSIDKDVLSPGTAQTNWDQGSMSLCEMEEIIRFISQEEQIIGVDICGECTAAIRNMKNETAERKNNMVNEELLRLFQRLQ